jgi:hypothetical protein
MEGKRKEGKEKGIKGEEGKRGVGKYGGMRGGVN